MKRYIKDDKKLKHEPVQCDPLQIIVGHSFEDAVRKFKSLFQKEKIVAKFKEKQSYEKPSAKKRRKVREAAERRALLEQREALMRSGEWDKRQQKKELKRQTRMQKRVNKVE